MAYPDNLEGGLTEAQWRRFEPPDLSELDPRAVDIPLDEAVRLLELPETEVGNAFLERLGIAGTAEFNWKSTPPPDPNSVNYKFGFWLSTALFPTEGQLRIDLTQYPAPNRLDHTVHAVGSVARWLWQGGKLGELKVPTEPTVRLSSLMAPGGRTPRV